MHGKGAVHDERLRLVIERLEENGLTLNPLKCKLGQQEVTWFGFFILNKECRMIGRRWS